MNKRTVHKLIVNVGIFAAIMVLTVWSVFRKQNIAEIVDAVRQMSGEYLAVSVFLAVLFVSLEGCMIWYLLKGIGEQTALQCP